MQYTQAGLWGGKYLFISDSELAESLLGKNTKGYAAIIKTLEKEPGFPPKRALLAGRRYWPAIVRWFDEREMGAGRARPAHADDGPETF